VLKIQERTEKAQRGELEKLRRQTAAWKRKEGEARAKAKQDAEVARKHAVLAERRKSAIRDKRLVASIRKLEEEKRMLQKHTSLKKWASQTNGYSSGNLKKSSPKTTSSTSAKRRCSSLRQLQQGASGLHRLRVQADR